MAEKHFVSTEELYCLTGSEADWQSYPSGSVEGHE